MATDKAMFAAGCFWGVESAFRRNEGVTKIVVGYSGGTTKKPTYEEVCTGKTGHAECLYVEFDTKKATYENLIEVFWGCHDPTTLNRQGPDIGSQYRSAIFYFTPEQEKAAREAKAKVDSSRRFPRPIVTEITEASKFWPAEEYHQQYFEKRGIPH